MPLCTLQGLVICSNEACETEISDGSVSLDFTEGDPYQDYLVLFADTVGTNQFYLGVKAQNESIAKIQAISYSVCGEGYEEIVANPDVVSYLFTKGSGF